MREAGCSVFPGGLSVPNLYTRWSVKSSEESMSWLGPTMVAGPFISLTNHAMWLWYFNWLSLYQRCHMFKYLLQRYGQHRTPIECIEKTARTFCQCCHLYVIKNLLIMDRWEYVLTKSGGLCVWFRFWEDRRMKGVGNRNPAPIAGRASFSSPYVPRHQDYQNQFIFRPQTSNTIFKNEFPPTCSAFMSPIPPPFLYPITKSC